MVAAGEMSWDRVLAALAAEAWQLRGTPGFPAACARIVDSWVVWPLVEANEKIDRARGELEQRQRVDGLALFLRTTYDEPEPCVA